MKTLYYYDHPDGRRALLTVIERGDEPQRSRLLIRRDHGHGDLLHEGKYQSRSAARSALARRGGDEWKLYDRKEF